MLCDHIKASFSVSFLSCSEKTASPGLAPYTSQALLSLITQRCNGQVFFCFWVEELKFRKWQREEEKRGERKWNCLYLAKCFHQDSWAICVEEVRSCFLFLILESLSSQRWLCSGAALTLFPFLRLSTEDSEEAAAATTSLKVGQRLSRCWSMTKFLQFFIRAARREPVFLDTYVHTHRRLVCVYNHSSEGGCRVFPLLNTSTRINLWACILSSVTLSKVTQSWSESDVFSSLSFRPQELSSSSQYWFISVSQTRYFREKTRHAAALNDW